MSSSGRVMPRSAMNMRTTCGLGPTELMSFMMVLPGRFVCADPDGVTQGLARPVHSQGVQAARRNVAAGR
jgi:hypothetical protein